MRRGIRLITVRVHLFRPRLGIPGESQVFASSMRLEKWVYPRIPVLLNDRFVGNLLLSVFLEGGSQSGWMYLMQSNLIQGTSFPNPSYQMLLEDLSEYSPLGTSATIAPAQRAKSFLYQYSCSPRDDAETISLEV